MNRHGKRFEVACYRNKILNYRQGIETDLSEVLQTDRVFVNVSKGLFASSKDLLTAFATSNQDDVCQIILDSGQVQIGDMERSATLENTAREVASMVVAKCVHPVSNRPYTMGQVRDAMKEAEFSVQPTTARSVKQQFLDCVRAIQKKGVLDIHRARMELAINFGGDAVVGGAKDLTRRLETEAQALIVRTNDAVSDEGGDVEIDRIQFLIDPSQYRTIDAIAKESGGTLEMLRHAVTQEGDADVSSELERNTLRQTEHDAAAALKLSNVRQTGNEGHHSQQQSNSVIAALASDVGAVLSLDHNRHTHNPQHDDDDDIDAVSSRKKNKKAQKKSKKAKRREKEEAALRQERKDAEIARREEREFRLGKSQNTTEGDGDGVVNSGVGGNGDVGGGGGARKSCNTCGGSFTPAQYRVHFRSDWHRYNIKLKMKGATHVDEKEFLMIDSDAFFDGTM
mmetsp:Transcript_27467/g.32488  ORF Transcript_27467/g.32488 Transcript_27467/m.32488 type:complete len:454 (+) Transcript_27467:1-1362(+)